MEIIAGRDSPATTFTPDTHFCCCLTSALVTAQQQDDLAQLLDLEENEP